MERKALLDCIRLAKQNDQKAFGVLFDIHWDYLFGFLIKNTGDEMLSEEIALQTLAKAFDKIHTYDENYSFKTWLIQISKNLQFDHLKNKHTQARKSFTSIEKEYRTEFVQENTSPEDLLIINQNLNELLEKIKELKPNYAQILRLRYFEEMSYKELSTHLDTPINTIKVTLLRAKKLLAQKITK